MIRSHVVCRLAPGQTLNFHSHLKQPRNHAWRHLNVFPDLPLLVEQVLDAAHRDVLQRCSFPGLTLRHFDAGLFLRGLLQSLHVQVIGFGPLQPVPLGTQIPHHADGSPDLLRNLFDRTLQSFHISIQAEVRIRPHRLKRLPIPFLNLDLGHDTPTASLRMRFLPSCNDSCDRSASPPVKDLDLSSYFPSMLGRRLSWGPSRATRIDPAESIDDGTLSVSEYQGPIRHTERSRAGNLKNSMTDNIVFVVTSICKSHWDSGQRGWGSIPLSEG